MNLDLLEQILSKVEIFDWCTGQQIYSILLKKQIERHELSFFEPSQYQDQTEFRDGGDEQIARHYWSSVGTLDEYLPDRKKIIKELLNASKVDKI